MNPRQQSIIADDVLQHVHQLRGVYHVEKRCVGSLCERLSEEILHGDAGLPASVQSVRRAASAASISCWFSKKIALPPCPIALASSQVVRALASARRHALWIRLSSGGGKSSHT